MSFCWRHPSVLALEVGWRWLFGIPFLTLLWGQAQRILVAIPPESAGLDRINFQNPWTSSVLLADAAGIYHPAVAEALRTIVPIAIVAWAILSGIGRTLVLWRIRSLDSAAGAPTLGFALRRLPGFIVLQELWLLVLLGCFWLWYRGVAWAAETHITSAAEPDLIGYLIWLIFLSLGFFVLWALLSWVLSVAPVLLFHEPSLNSGAALVRSFRLGRAFSSKLMEINLVMAIVKIALIVLAMVFSAAPLPFSDQFGPDVLHVLYMLIAVAFLIANDYFHVVRLRSFAEFWRHFSDRSKLKKVLKLASTNQIDVYSSHLDDFFKNVYGEEYQELWVSDKSSLWDFATGRTLEPYIERIKKVYGVDVSDIEGALLWKILRRIVRRD